MAKGKIKQQDSLFRASGDVSSGSCDVGGSAVEGIIVTTSGSYTDGSVSSRDTPRVERTRKRKSAPRESPSLRSSSYRGVTRHRWTGRYEAHLWDKDWLNTSRKKKGRQVYLGAYDEEEAAACAYDLAALKFWGRDTVLNFPLSRHEEEVKEMEGLSREEYVGSLRRKSSGFSRGVSKYRGVARHHQNGRWEARIGKVFGNKYLYLGTYGTQEEAAKAYDMAAIQYRGLNAITNFDVSRYATYLRPTSAGHDANPSSSHASSGSSDNRLAPGGVPAPAINFHPDEDGRSSGTTQPWGGGGGDSGAGDSPAPAPGVSLHTCTFERRPVGSGSSTFAAEGPPTPEESLDSTGASSRCSFPDDVQTYFGCQDSAAAADVDDFVFGDLDAFVSSVFQWEGLLDC